MLVSHAEIIERERQKKKMANPVYHPVASLPASTNAQYVQITQKGKSTHKKEEKSNVTTTMMLDEWNKDTTHCDAGTNDLDKSKDNMNYLNVKLRQLRKSQTIHEMRKASLYVAAALLIVAADVNCQNPFVCLRQARIFASHCDPGADNDMFRKPLPKNEQNCTPLQALLVIGHADCMSALSYIDESVFLCRYVGRLCASRRKDKQIWNPQWRIVAVNLCIVASRIKTSTAFSWGVEVQTELDAASDDFSSLMRGDLTKST